MLVDEINHIAPVPVPDEFGGGVDGRARQRVEAEIFRQYIEQAHFFRRNPGVQHHEVGGSA